MEDSQGRCAALISGEAIDYIRERLGPFKNILMSIFGAEEFEPMDSSTSAQGYINAKLNIFNRFAEKVSFFSSFFFRRDFIFAFYFRVMVLL
jgi:hypothetical protein